MVISEFIAGSKGARKRFASFNKLTGTIELRSASGCTLYHVVDNCWTPFNVGQAVSAPLDYNGLLSATIDVYGSISAQLVNVLPNGTDGDVLDLSGVGFELGMDIDSDRDGQISTNEQGDSNWVWGSGQKGAIVLVNNDRDPDDFTAGGYKSELASFIVRPTLASSFPSGVQLALITTVDAGARFSVYRNKQGQSPEVLLGRDFQGNVIPMSPPLDLAGEKLYIEAHEFPGPFFEGLISLDLVVIRLATGEIFAEDRVVFRVAPWVMTPNHLPPIQVYTCEMKDATGNVTNQAFLDDLSRATGEVGVPLQIVPPKLNNPSGDGYGDRWIQDEIEFGYSMGPDGYIPVVFDSPRDRQLDGFPEAALLGPDFGHFQVGGSTPNSLDSFGNLEASPPVTVAGREYPLGRIIFGGRKYGDYGSSSRQMMPEVRRFLYAQKVQSPIEIYTDWLAVGHVDEIICFVPANNAIGFQMLIASPNRCLSILQRLEVQGHGSTLMFQGMKRSDGSSAEMSISTLLQDNAFWKANATFQKHMDLNRDILKRELAITDADIIEIPVAFWPPETQRTLAFFPDMVNHLVLGKWNLVPKPHGPVVNGVDQFEQAFIDALPGRRVRFIEDWYSYHEMSGEVHCGTNTLRHPPAGAHWWDTKPEGGFDI
jgi:protein-arginine deiminase